MKTSPLVRTVRVKVLTVVWPCPLPLPLVAGRAAGSGARSRRLLPVAHCVHVVVSFEGPNSTLEKRKKPTYPDTNVNPLLHNEGPAPAIVDDSEGLVNLEGEALRRLGEVVVPAAGYLAALGPLLDGRFGVFDGEEFGDGGCVG
ncbi:hypothetical protein BR93DRAFT_544399 [Coniochaeta sp. PMI_546]|nr:hypothetical protein BR93DRAFT_544399 [Coniochaeta sp. PMI_546]